MCSVLLETTRAMTEMRAHLLADASSRKAEPFASFSSLYHARLWPDERRGLDSAFFAKPDKELTAAGGACVRRIPRRLTD